MIKNVKSTVPWPYVIEDLNGEEVVQTFYQKQFQKANKIDIDKLNTDLSKLSNVADNAVVRKTVFDE